MFEAVATNVTVAPTQCGHGLAVSDTDGVIDGLTIIEIALDAAVVDR